MLEQAVDREHGARQHRLAVEQVEHADLVFDRRVLDEQLEEEAVDLRLGQRVGALGLDRVLRREHEKRARDVVGLTGDRHLLLLHDLEQRRLDLRRRAVDLAVTPSPLQEAARMENT
ncbi:MAG: hypothetical protein QOJ89_3985, partial [bacterium]